MSILLREEITNDPKNRHLWEVPLREAVYPPGAPTKRELWHKSAGGELVEACKNPDLKWIPHPFREDIEIATYSGDFDSFANLLRCSETKEFLSGIRSMLITNPAHYGEGYGAELQFLRLMKHGIRGRFHLTDWGFRATRSAHRLAVERALEEGISVPDRVLSDYTVHDGRLQLIKPYEPQDANEIERRAEHLENGLIFRSFQGDYKNTLLSEEEFQTWNKRIYPNGLELGYLALALQERNYPVVMASYLDEPLGVYLETPAGYISEFGFVGKNLPDRHPREYIEPDVRSKAAQETADMALNPFEGVKFHRFENVLASDPESGPFAWEVNNVQTQICYFNEWESLQGIDGEFYRRALELIDQMIEQDAASSLEASL